jgi:ribose-phosphate pyrophosphokinase
MYTVIDSDNYAAAGIDTMWFPGGEPHVKVPASLTGNVLAFLKLRTWADVGIAGCLIDALCRDSNVETLATFIPYFPGARQDKVKRNGSDDPFSPLTLALMADFLTHENYTAVFDAHSRVLFDFCRPISNVMPKDLRLPIAHDVVGIIAPDEGAVERAASFRNMFYPQANILQCRKRRDPITGKLSGYEMPKLPAIGRYMIVDDICDGGGTFNLLADEFIEDEYFHGSRLELFVSHGIFSKSLENISPVIERITTTDSWCQLKNSERLTVIPLNQVFDKIMGDCTDA